MLLASAHPIAGNSTSSEMGLPCSARRYAASPKPLLHEMVPCSRLQNGVNVWLAPGCFAFENGTIGRYRENDGDHCKHGARKCSSWLHTFVDATQVFAATGESHRKNSVIRYVLDQHLSEFQFSETHWLTVPMCCTRSWTDSLTD